MSAGTGTANRDPLREFAVEVAERLAAAGQRALFAGGCVRDQLLGRRPKDYDVATSARPEQVIALFPRTVPVGVAFGVVRVLGPRLEEEGPPLQVEVATFRSESGYSDGRHPDQVAFSDEVEDVKRRDFTINGLLFDPRSGQVVDHVGGRADLERRLIRAIGEPESRFAEDRLRLLRAVRFSAALDFAIEPATFAAIQRVAPGIHAVAAERIREELVKMLTGPRPERALRLLKETRLLKEVLPEVEALAGVEQPPQFHPEGDVWVHTLRLLAQLEYPSETLALGALLHDIGKPPTFEVSDGRIRFNTHEKVGAAMAEEILRRLRFPNQTIAEVTELVRQHMVFKDVTQMRPATLKRFLRMPKFEEHLELHRIDCLASHGGLDSHRFCQEQRAELSAERLAPRPLVTGHDLIALGLEPGPLFGKILREVEDRQLEGILKSREEALGYLRERYPVGKGAPRV